MAAPNPPKASSRLVFFGGFDLLKSILCNLFCSTTVRRDCRRRSLALVVVVVLPLAERNNYLYVQFLLRAVKPQRERYSREGRDTAQMKWTRRLFSPQQQTKSAILCSVSLRFTLWPFRLFKHNKRRPKSAPDNFQCLRAFNPIQFKSS